MIKGITYRIEHGFREFTNVQRALPDFIIIGGMKCGSTALYNYITQHPDVLAGVQKEVHYFDNNYGKGLNWYRTFFPLQHVKRNRLTCEASPYYIFHPKVAQRIKRALPDVKLVAVLRNPVDRAFSHYQHTKRKGYEPLSFKEAIEQEGERLAGELGRLLSDDDYNASNFQAYSYKHRGVYWKQLERYLSCFDRTQLLILQSESLLRNPQREVDKVYRFLGIDSFRMASTKPQNEANYVRGRTETHDMLAEYYRPHNRRLFELIGDEFDWS